MSISADSIVHVNDVFEGNGALVNEAGVEQLLNAGYFLMVMPDKKHQYRYKSNVPSKMI